MEYELEKWDRFISMTLQPSNLGNFIVNEESLRLLADQSETKRDAVRQQMIQVVFSLTKEKAIALFVHQHQAVLIRLIDQVYQYERQEDLEIPVKNMYHEIGAHLEFVLHFIENYFDKYFNFDERLPVSYLENAATYIANRFQLCKDALRRAGLKDEKLIAVISESFEDLCGERKHFTYRDLRYRDTLITDLATLCHSQKKESIHRAVLELLIHSNFNSNRFFHYVMSVIHEEIKQIPVIEEKIEKLAVHVKEIAQIPPRPAFELQPRSPSAKLIISEAIEKELHFLRSFNAGPTIYTNRNNIHPSPPVVTEPCNTYEAVRQQVFLPFKGAEIYLLHKAFIDAGGAPGEIYKTLLEKTAVHLANKTVKGFSAESICKYSDKVTPEVKDDVKRFLQKMIRNIDSYD